MQVNDTLPFPNQKGENVYFLYCPTSGVSPLCEEYIRGPPPPWSQISPFGLCGEPLQNPCWVFPLCEYKIPCFLLLKDQKKKRGRFCLPHPAKLALGEFWSLDEVNYVEAFI